MRGLVAVCLPPHRRLDRRRPGASRVAALAMAAAGDGRHCGIGGVGDLGCGGPLQGMGSRRDTGSGPVDPVVALGHSVSAVASRSRAGAAAARRTASVGRPGAGAERIRRNHLGHAGPSATDAMAGAAHDRRGEPGDLSRLRVVVGDDGRPGCRRTALPRHHTEPDSRSRSGDREQSRARRLPRVPSAASCIQTSFAAASTR